MRENIIKENEKSIAKNFFLAISIYFA